MFKSFLLVLVVLSAAAQIEPGYQTATLQIRSPNAATPTQSQVFHLKPISYASIYPAAEKQVVKVVRQAGNDGCKHFETISPEQNTIVFLLVDGKEGLCTFNKRAHNAKKSSANGIIIVNYQYAISNFNLISSKDYFQVFLLQEAQGPALLAQTSPFFAEIRIKKPVNKEISVAELWVSSLNEKSYDVVSWWGSNLKKIPDLYKKVTWQPRFAYISCKQAENNTCGGDIASCACGGVFCSPQKHGKSSNVLVREDIRQRLVFKESSDKFLAYMTEFKQRCLSNYIATGFAQDCASSLLTHLQLDQAAINQKIDSFLSSCEQKEGNLDHLQLYQRLILDEGKFRQINNYPTITLNHEILSVKNQNELKDELCRKLAMQKQNGCYVEQHTTITNESNVWSTLLWTVFGILLAAAAIFGILKFRNKLRHEMNKQLKMQVSTAVEHYFTLAQTNASK